jgi:acetyl-CoA carboxylase carboxyl transferase subunit alpha
MDEVIPEPLGGAHSDPVAAFPAIKAAIMGTFRHYENMSEREIQLDRCGSKQQQARFEYYVSSYMFVKLKCPTRERLCWR